jgi:hypothetical protein
MVDQLRSFASEVYPCRARSGHRRQIRRPGRRARWRRHLERSGFDGQARVIQRTQGLRLSLGAVSMTLQKRSCTYDTPASYRSGIFLAMRVECTLGPAILIPAGGHYNTGTSRIDSCKPFLGFAPSTPLCWCEYCPHLIVTCNGALTLERQGTRGV